MVRIHVDESEGLVPKSLDVYYLTQVLYHLITLNVSGVPHTDVGPYFPAQRGGYAYMKY